MAEHALMFAGSSASLFGVFHEAEGTPRGTGFVFCHAFCEEKLWSHRVLVSFARALAARGHCVLRFDYMGNGDSGGEFAHSTVSTALDDVDVAIEALKSQGRVEKVGLLGLRFGAAIATAAAERRQDVSTLVLWAPVLDGRGYAQELLRINVTTQMAVYKEVRRDRAELIRDMQAGGTANVDGFEMSLNMFEEMSATNLLASPKSFQGRCLVAQTERAAAAPPRPDLQSLASGYRDATLLVVQEEPFWKEIERFYQDAPNLEQATLGWLASQS
jgi:uncharacterized protein